MEIFFDILVGAQVLKTHHFHVAIVDNALKILDKHMLKLCYSLMLFPLMIVLYLKKIINSLES